MGRVHFILRLVIHFVPIICTFWNLRNHLVKVLHEKITLGTTNPEYMALQNNVKRLTRLFALVLLIFCLTSCSIPIIYTTWFELYFRISWRMLHNFIFPSISATILYKADEAPATTIDYPFSTINVKPKRKRKSKNNLGNSGNLETIPEETKLIESKT